MKESGDASKVFSWTVLLLLSLVWGSSFILMKKGMEVFTPSQVAALRIFIAFLCLFPFIAGKLGKVKGSLWTYLAAVGLLGNCIPAFLFTRAETTLSSSAAGVLNALTPLFTLVISVFLFRIRLSTANIIGVLLGFIGAGGLVLVRSDGTFSSDYFHGGLVVIATICYAFSVNIIRNRLYGLDSLLIAGCALMTVGPFCGLYLFGTDFVPRLSRYDGATEAFGYVCILAVLGTAVSLVLYNKLIKVAGALFASSTTYFIPAVAILWGMVDNEKPGLVQLVGLTTILAGVYLVNKK
jgi:drug/metabolite transporter (DMT)-like permease